MVSILDRDVSFPFIAVIAWTAYLLCLGIYRCMEMVFYGWGVRMNAEALQYTSALSPIYQDQSLQVRSYVPSLDFSLMLHAVSALYCQRYH